MADINTLVKTHFSGLGLRPVRAMYGHASDEVRAEQLAAIMAWRAEAIRRYDAFDAAAAELREEASGMTALIFDTTTAATDDGKAAVAQHFARCLAGEYDN